MAINPDDKPRLDTRGLPEGCDPHMFYEYRRDTLVKSASGIESFVYKYIPWSISRSFAFAIDPFAKFKVAPHRITPKNRNRVRGVASVLQMRTTKRHFYAISHNQTPNFGGIAICWSPGLAETLTADAIAGPTELTTQPVLHDESNDTTKRTRLIGSEQGTFDSFKSTLSSPPRYVYKWNRYNYVYHPAPGIPSPECSERGGTANTRSDSSENWTQEIVPTAAVFFPNSLKAVRDNEIARCDQLMSQNAISMFKEWAPIKRDYTLFRNLVELRDVPRSIISLQKTCLDLGVLFKSLGTQPKLRDSIFSLTTAAKNIPNEYLSYHFGWKQLYKDVMDLLALPEKSSKKSSFLIKRAGKPTTFRFKRVIPFRSVEGVPGFDYDTSMYEYGVTQSNACEGEVELRMVINAVFDFPPVNDVSFKSGRLFDRIGAVPRPTDIYNLIPWTWLLDWFTGLGNYIELIDDMNRDSSLINWGMMTAVAKGKITSNYKSKVDNRSYIIEDFVGTTETISTSQNNHTSVLEYEYRIRKDLATVLDVKTTAAPNLSGYQQSILGALLAQRIDHTTPRTFRPRS
jgi:hypothetical protein